jgi:hypothetical protein
MTTLFVYLREHLMRAQEGSDPLLQQVAAKMLATFSK